ncbi:MAG TPA: hypothetical protein VL486_02860 [Verrucomicrobiae bacterium]|nr:hypothetical protein [Verrucomicrobiae bacterium]
MRTVAVFFLFCSLAVATALADQPAPPAPATATNNTSLDATAGDVSSNSVTIDGVTYHDVRWGRLTPSTVTLYHSTGIATMPLATLPPDLQKQFGYDPQKAAAWEASVQKVTTARQAAERQADQARKAEEEKAAAAKAEADKQKASAAAHSAHTNAPPQTAQQNSRPTGGVTISALKQRIQRSYSQSGN